MNKRRFYYPGTIEADSKLSLVGEEFNHIKVLRLKEGARITIFDGHGNEAEAVIERIEHDQAKVKVEKVKRVENPSPAIVLAVSPIKANRMDFLLEKSCELGVNEILPILFERTIIKMSLANWDNKRARWEKILVSAAKQSKRADLPKLSKPIYLKELSNLLTANDILILCDISGMIPEKLSLSKFKRIFTIVGPEGGLSEQEKELLMKLGAKCMPLSTNVLRTETACIAALSIISFLLKKEM